MNGPDARLRASIEQYSSAHPKLTGMYATLLKHRVAALVVLSAIRGWLDSFPPVISRDLRLFSSAGRAILDGRLWDVYSAPEVQIGPVALIFYGLNSLLADTLGIRLEVGISIGVTVALTVLSLIVMRMAWRSIQRQPTEGFELFFGLVIVLGGITFEAVSSAHASEAFIPLLWVTAALTMMQGHAGKAGAFLALAGLLKAWGVLGAPLLLLSPSMRKWLNGTSTMGGLTVLAYVPFILAGPLATLSFAWVVKPQSPLRVLIEPGTEFGWGYRSLQAFVIVTVGAIMTASGRGRAGTAWLVPLTMVGVRLLTDPLDYHYYILPIGVLGLIAAGAVIPFEPSWWRIPMASGFYVILVPFFFLKGGPEALYIAGVSIAVLLGSLLMFNRQMSDHPALA